MDAIIELISSNALVSTLIGAIIISIITWLLRFIQSTKDTNSILTFLKASKDDAEYTFRSTEAIASDANLTENRVALLCAKHPKVKRNTNEKQSWRLIE